MHTLKFDSWTCWNIAVIVLGADYHVALRTAVQGNSNDYLLNVSDILQDKIYYDQSFNRIIREIKNCKSNSTIYQNYFKLYNTMEILQGRLLDFTKLEWSRGE